MARIVADYEAALRAVEADDLGGLDDLLTDVEQRLASLEAATGDSARALLTQAQASHAALTAKVAEARAGLAAALEHVRTGKRALAGYTPGSTETGARLDRDA